MDGYIKFTTNGAHNYVFTNSPLLKEKNTLKTVITCFIFIIFVIALIILVLYNKKQKTKNVIDDLPPY